MADIGVERSFRTLAFTLDNWFLDYIFLKDVIIKKCCGKNFPLQIFKSFVFFYQTFGAICSDFQDS
jgi:hypothetical protein